MFLQNLGKDKTGANYQDAYIVGIDPSITSTGVYMHGIGKQPDYGYCLQTTSKCRDFDRVSSIYCELKNDLSNVRVVAAAFEDYGPINRTSGKITQRAELVGMLKYFILNDLGIPFIMVAPKSLKKWLTGNGNVGKEVMKQQVTAQFGYIPETDDDADACALARLCRNVFSGNKISVPFEMYRKY